MCEKCILGVEKRKNGWWQSGVYEHCLVLTKALGKAEESISQRLGTRLKKIDDLLKVALFSEGVFMLRMNYSSTSCFWLVSH